MAAPSPRSPFHVISPSAADIAALAPLLSVGPIPREQPGDPALAYLRMCISKPWGWEVKIYEDAVSEAWILVVLPGKGTSLHAHLRKATILVCIDGAGRLETIAGERIALEPGVAVLVMAGALHRSFTATGMRLVEFESPKDKFDLVRLESSSEPGPPRPYEGGQAVLTSVVAGVEIPPLESVPGGPPLALVREHCTEQLFGFAVENGERVNARPPGLTAAISVDLEANLRGEYSVVTPSSASRAVDAAPHLTVTALRDAG